MHNNKRAQSMPTPISTPKFRYSLLAVSLWSIHASAFAMQELNEQSMRQVDGQDGLIVETQYDSINIDRLYWEDKAGLANGSDTALRGYADGISVAGTNLGTNYQINTGSSAAGKAGLDFKIDSHYGTVKADSFSICDSAGNNCGYSIGGIALQSQEDATIHFITQDGLFNKDILASAEIALKRVNIFLTQREVANNTASIKNQLISKDFNFNFAGSGYIYIDETGGLILETRTDGYVDLIPVEDLTNPGKFKPGLNIDFVVKSNTGSTFSTAGALGLIRIGASGRLTNAKMAIRGTDGTDTAGESILGKAFSAANGTTTADAGSKSIIGSTGVATRLSANFTNGSNGTTLELGHGGTNAYSLQFSNFTPLLIRKQNGGGAFNTDSAYFDSGNVYINLANTKRMLLPSNTVLNNAPFLAGKLTTAADYSQQIHNQATNPNSLIVAIRGADFQAISRQTRFISSTDVTGTNIPTDTGTWGLGLPIYNLNGNMAIYGTTSTGADTGAERLGFAMGLSTQGVSADGTKSTSILLIDGKKYGQALGAGNVRTADTSGDPINYYMGIRNIDMLLNGYGTIGLEGGKINISLPSFTFAASGEVAVGYLPGSQYKTSLGGTAKYAPINGFSSKSDVQFGLRLRLDGSVDMTLTPGTDTLAGNRISFDGNLNITKGAIQIVEPVDGSIVGFDNMSGKMSFSNQIKINKDNVDFNASLVVNPSKTPTDVLRIKDLNFYPATGGTLGAAQRIGEMVITGGTLTSKFNIMPH